MFAGQCERVPIRGENGENATADCHSGEDIQSASGDARRYPEWSNAVELFVPGNAQNPAEFSDELLLDFVLLLSSLRFVKTVSFILLLFNFVISVAS